MADDRVLDLYLIMYLSQHLVLGESSEEYVCGSVGCSVNGFIHRSRELVPSVETARCGELVSINH